MTQVYVPYWLWEDWHNGMWRDVFGESRNELLRNAIEFTGDAQLYGSWMLNVVKNWHWACLHNLTNPSINHRAFIGHCACCMAIGCPEDITRLAWHNLSQKQQDDANQQATNAIELWNTKYNKGIQACLNLA